MQNSTTPYPNTPTVSITEAAQRLELSRSAVYDAIKRGNIPVVEIGRKRVITRPAFERLIMYGSACLEREQPVLDAREVARELRTLLLEEEEREIRERLESIRRNGIRMI